MALMVAIHKIGYDGVNVATGEYNPLTGEAITRRETIYARPGEMFNCPDGELEYLRSLGAVRDPTEAELAVRERQARLAPNPEGGEA